jgi:hypothetical protein
VRFSTKILVVGAGLALAVWLAGKANTHRLERREAAARAECESTNASSDTPHEITDPVLLALLNSSEGEYPRWAAVVASAQYQALSPNEREQARERYFRTVVAPRVPAGELKTVRKQFDADTDPYAHLGATDPQDREYFVPDPAAFDMGPIYEALKKADAAGNAVTARRLADYIRRVWAWQGRAKSTAPQKEFDLKTVCDGATLLALRTTTDGIQARVAAAYTDRLSSEGWALPFALGILALSVVPWLWYSLLRRVAELRAAIGGQAPNR